ncbi:DUF483 domain-containing protein [Methanocaldococcus infernus]
MIEEIIEKIKKMRNGEGEFKVLKEHIMNLDEVQYNIILERLKIEDEIVKKYKPKVRPALDPYVSGELGIYRRLDDHEIGKFLNYPECCIKSFTEEVRVSIDREHLKEAEEINKRVVITSGFIPCSLKCKEAIKRGLLGHLNEKELEVIKKVNEELKKRLGSFNIFYEDFYDFIK